MTTDTTAAVPAVELTNAEKFKLVANEIISSTLKQNDAAKLRKLRPLILEILDGATEADAEERKLKVFKAFWESHPEMLDCIKKVIRSKKTKDGKPRHDLAEGIFSLKAGVGFLQVDLYVQAVAEYRKDSKPAASDTRKYDDWLLTNKQQGRRLRYWMNDINESMKSILEEMGAKEPSAGRGPKKTVDAAPFNDDQLAKLFTELDNERLVAALGLLVEAMQTKGVTVDVIETTVFEHLKDVPLPVAA